MEWSGYECLIGNPGTELREDWTDWLNRARRAGTLGLDDQLEAVRAWLRDAAERGVLDEEGCIEAVDFDGSLLEDVPPGLRTERVRRAALPDGAGFGGEDEQNAGRTCCAEK